MLLIVGVSFILYFLSEGNRPFLLCPFIFFQSIVVLVCRYWFNKPESTEFTLPATKDMSTTLSCVAAGFSAHLGVDIKSKDDAFQYAMSTRRGQVYPQKIDIKTLFSLSHNIVMAMPFYHYIQVFGEEFVRYQMDPFRSRNYLVSDIKKELASYCGVHPSCQTLMYESKELHDHLSLTQVRHALNTINFMLH